MKYAVTEIDGYAEDLVLVFDADPDEDTIAGRLKKLRLKGPKSCIECTTVPCADKEEWVQRIRNEWHIDKIVEAVESGDPYTPEGADDDVKAQLAYLGAMINPSGKYYLPFACSNVAGDCEVCKGKGHIRNQLHDAERLREAKRELDELTAKCRELYGWPVDWPNTHRTRAKKLSDVIACYGEELECPRCEGSGSQSAMDDENWREAFEEILGEHDLCLEQGCGGDGCDFYAVKYLVLDEEVVND